MIPDSNISMTIIRNVFQRTACNLGAYYDVVGTTERAIIRYSDLRGKSPAGVTFCNQIRNVSRKFAGVGTNDIRSNVAFQLLYQTNTGDRLVSGTTNTDGKDFKGITGTLNSIQVIQTASTAVSIALVAPPPLPFEVFTAYSSENGGTFTISNRDVYQFTGNTANITFVTLFPFDQPKPLDSPFDLIRIADYVTNIYLEPKTVVSIKDWRGSNIQTLSNNSTVLTGYPYSNNLTPIGYIEISITQ